jgi:hypothetical protein
VSPLRLVSVPAPEDRPLGRLATVTPSALPASLPGLSRSQYRSTSAFTMPPPSAPAPDYSAAWAAYYQVRLRGSLGRPRLRRPRLFDSRCGSLLLCEPAPASAADEHALTSPITTALFLLDVPFPSAATGRSRRWRASRRPSASASALRSAHRPGSQSDGLLARQDLRPRSHLSLTLQMGAYGSFVPQAPYGGMPGYPGASQPAYLGLPPMGIQPRPPTYAQPAPQQAYTPSVGPQAYPSARPMQAPQTPQPQPMGGYSPYAPGAGGFGGARPPPAGPQAMPMRPPSAASSHHPMGGMGPQQPMGMLHPSPNQGFPPAKRPRFDSGPQQPLAGPGGGAGPASRTISIPSSAGLPSNPMTIATPMSMVAGPSSSSTGGGGGGGGGNDFFSGSDGRDHGSMPRGPGGRGGSNSVRGGPKGMRGGFGYEDDGYGSVNGFRGKPRGIMRASPPPNGPTGPRNSGQSSSRSERGAFKGRGASF